MSSQARNNGDKALSNHEELESLYLQLLKRYYDEGNRKQAGQIASRLEKLLASCPEYADSIRAEEIRSLIAELRGDLVEAARSREAEIRKILELHELSVRTPNWKYVSRQYDFSDVSDRLDLLGILYDQQGERDRAIAVLIESKQYCESHQIPFDAQDVLDELEQERSQRSAKPPRRRLTKS